MTAEEGNQETAEEKKKRLAAEKKAQKELEKQKQKEEKAEQERLKKEAEAKAKEEEKARKAKEAEDKKKKKSSLADLAEDYELKQIGKLFIPAYFHRKKRYADYAEEKVDVYHASNFLFGMEIFAKQGSVSAKITYVGPNRKYTLNNVIAAKREARPSHNNWKTFSKALFLFKGKEHRIKVKDPKVIRDLLTSRGGKKNFKIRFVQDKKFTAEDAKKKVFAKDPVRQRNIQYRMKKDQAKLGIKPVLRNKEEALSLIKDIKSEVKDNKADHVITYLQKEVKKYIAIEDKEKEEAKKD